MQDKSNIDLKIREKLSNSTAPMPDGLFDSILEAMPAQVQQKKAFALYPYILLGLGLVLLLLFLKTCNTENTKAYNQLTANISEPQLALKSLNNIYPAHHAKTTLTSIPNTKKWKQVKRANKDFSYNFKLNEENKQFISNLGSYSFVEEQPRFFNINNNSNGSVLKLLPAVENTKENKINKLPYRKLITLPAFNSFDKTLVNYKRVKTSKFSLRLFGGPTLNYRTLRIDEYKELEAHRNEHERAYKAFTYGAHLNFDISNKLELFSGIQYLEVGEKYEFRHDTIEHITNNTYSYLSIPIGIGYTLTKSNRFYTMIRTQLNTSFNNASQASWIDPNSLNAVVHSNNAEHNPYRKITFSGRVSTEFGLSFNRLSIFASPTLNYTFSNIYKSEEAINQHPFSGGVNFGARIKL